MPPRAAVLPVIPVFPEAGAVLGIDIGWSVQRKSTAACVLAWDARHAGWEIRRFSARPEERKRVLAGLLAERRLNLAALDGPLHPHLLPLTQHREAERALTIGTGRLIGKPGSVSSPAGQKLHLATAQVARELLNRRALLRPRRADPWHPLGLVEAFPGAFLGTMLERPFPAPRATRLAAYFAALSGTESFGLLGLLCRLLPGRRILGDVVRIRQRDEQAAFVAALSALCVVARQFTAVGDAQGHIILPPLAVAAEDPGLQRWARHCLWTALRVVG